MLSITPVPAFQDNYIWLLNHGEYAAVVDPGDAEPVLAILKEKKWQLCAIFITHDHGDHVGGVDRLLQHYAATVYAPFNLQRRFLYQCVEEASVVEIAGMNLHFEVLATPGHTLNHVAYYGHGALFCGDTLFSVGCGRLFEGSASQMYQTLQRLAALPEATQVFCAHEYTLQNIRFACTIEPDNQDLQQYAVAAAVLRQQYRPTLPGTIGRELRVNPFLRCHVAEVQRGITASCGQSFEHPADFFCHLRLLKDRF